MNRWGRDQLDETVAELHRLVHERLHVPPERVRVKAFTNAGGREAVAFRMVHDRAGDDGLKAIVYVRNSDIDAGLTAADRLVLANWLLSVAKPTRPGAFCPSVDLVSWTHPAVIRRHRLV